MRWALILGQTAGVLDFNGLAAVMTALGGLLLTAGTVLSSRRQRTSVVTKDAVAQLDSRDLQVRAALRHLRRLEDALADAQLEVPPRPVELTTAWWTQRHGEENRHVRT